MRPGTGGRGPDMRAGVGRRITQRPVQIHQLNTKTECEKYSKLTIQTLERRQSCFYYCQHGAQFIRCSRAFLLSLNIMPVMFFKDCDSDRYELFFHKIGVLELRHYIKLVCK